MAASMSAWSVKVLAVLGAPAGFWAWSGFSKVPDATPEGPGVEPESTETTSTTGKYTPEPIVDLSGISTTWLAVDSEDFLRARRPFWDAFPALLFLVVAFLPTGWTKSSSLDSLARDKDEFLHLLGNPVEALDRLVRPTDSDQDLTELSESAPLADDLVFLAAGFFSFNFWSIFCDFGLESTDFTDLGFVGGLVWH